MDYDDDNYYYIHAELAKSSHLQKQLLWSLYLRNPIENEFIGLVSEVYITTR